MENLKNQTASFLHKLGVSADFLTVLGLLAAFSSGALVLSGHFFWAAVSLVFSGILDLLDGAVARSAGTACPFGGILDSSLDRYGEGFVLGGALFFCASSGKPLAATLAFSALLGSFLISYVRARAECAIDRCKVGFWERGERTTYLALGLFFNNLMLVLWVLGIATHWTVFQRLDHSYRRSRAGGEPARPALLAQHNRQSGAYFLKIGALFLAVLLWRIPLA